MHAIIALLIDAAPFERSLALYGRATHKLQPVASLKAFLQSKMRPARRRGAPWVRLLDLSRLAATAEGRGLLWTRIVHRNEVHQTTPYTREERYPRIFDLAANLAPNARRILSFGCSTGEELVSLRRRFPTAQIVGAEVNPRSRRIAARRVSDDPNCRVVNPRAIDGSFDVIFALAVFQREPHKFAQIGVENLSLHYPHERFDRAVRTLADALRTGGIFCIANAHYRIEDSSAGPQLEEVAESPRMTRSLFGPDGRRLGRAVAHCVFRKQSAGAMVRCAQCRSSSFDQAGPADIVIGHG